MSHYTLWDHERQLLKDGREACQRQSEIRLAHGRLIRAAEAFLDHFNPAGLPEDKSRQWLVLFDAVQASKTALPKVPG